MSQCGENLNPKPYNPRALSSGRRALSRRGERAFLKAWEWPSMCIKVLGLVAAGPPRSPPRGAPRAPVLCRRWGFVVLVPRGCVCAAAAGTGGCSGSVSPAGGLTQPPVAWRKVTRLLVKAARATVRAEVGG